MLLGVAPWVIVECGLRIGGAFRPGIAPDPYVDLRTPPLFEPDGDRLAIAPSRHRYFRPASFASPKPEGMRRVFCIGGSTVQGRPFSTETAFPSWLELSLRAADPTATYEVINCGGISYASYRLAPIVDEVLGHEPDLLIVYIGHNEFLEDRTFGHVARVPSWLRAPLGHLSTLRVFQLVRTAMVSLGVVDAGHPARFLPSEVEARLDFAGGLEDYVRDATWRDGVIEQFAANLARIVAATLAAGVELVLIDPVSNLRHCPPFKVEPDPTLSTRDRDRLQELLVKAKSLSVAQAHDRLTILDEALSLDPGHAGALFSRAASLDALGRFDAARDAYIVAKDADVCPLRMLEPMHQILARTADRAGVPLVDARGAFRAAAAHGIIGDDLLIDHVHPTIAGHQRIAALVFDELERLGWVRRSGGYDDRRQHAYAGHLASLNPAYHQQGQARLMRLRRWTQGRAERIRGDDR